MHDAQHGKFANGLNRHGSVVFVGLERLHRKYSTIVIIAHGDSSTGTISKTLRAVVVSPREISGCQTKHAAKASGRVVWANEVPVGYDAGALVDAPGNFKL
jgi:hypothetical protein